MSNNKENFSVNNEAFDRCPRCNSKDLSERLIYVTSQAEVTCNYCDFIWYEETSPVGSDEE